MLIACGLVAAVVFGRLPSTALWAEVVANSAHGPVFTIITVIVLMLGYKREFGQRGLILGSLLTIVFAITVGAGIEFVQSMIGGDAEFQDIVNDAVGAIAGAGLFIFAVELSNKESPAFALRWGSLLTSIVAAAFIAAPVATMGVAYWARDTRFPVLFDADSLLATYFMHAYDGSSAEVQRMPMSGKYGMRVKSGTSFPWGLLFSNNYPNWQDKRYFAVQLVNPTNHPLTLQLRVYDGVRGAGRPNGFYTPLSLAPHSSSIKRLSLVDLAAATGIQHVDLSAVAGIVFYGDRDNQANEFYVLKMWLE